MIEGNSSVWMDWVTPFQKEKERFLPRVTGNVLYFCKVRLRLCDQNNFKTDYIFSCFNNGGNNVASSAGILLLSEIKQEQATIYLMRCLYARCWQHFSVVDQNDPAWIEGKPELWSQLLLLLLSAAQSWCSMGKAPTHPSTQLLKPPLCVSHAVALQAR